MPDYSRQFYVEQLKAHLEYYRELGIDGLSLKMNPWSAPSIISSESRNSRSSVSEFHAKSEVGSEATRGVERLSLFETSVTDQVSKESLETIRTDLGDCRRCKLCSTRTNIVFGSGTPKAELVFVGEGPGADEDVQGLPFVGKAGQLLTKIIEAIQLKRDQVYICNVVKCRPPGNRFPEEDEIAACSPFLFRQLESIRPKVICCLGAAAAQTILRTKASIGKLRGRFHEYRGIKVIPTYHPSYLLRNPEAKRDVWEDMKKIRLLLNELG
jgi:uracil-DNA glycosylase family 4